MAENRYQKHFKRLRPIVAEGRGILLLNVGRFGFVDETGNGTGAQAVYDWLNTTATAVFESRIGSNYVFYEFKDSVICSLFKMAFNLIQTDDGLRFMGSGKWGKL
jgi:hypothetical protein